MFAVLGDAHALLIADLWFNSWNLFTGSHLRRATADPGHLGMGCRATWCARSDCVLVFHSRHQSAREARHGRAGGFIPSPLGLAGRRTSAWVCWPSQSPAISLLFQSRSSGGSSAHPVYLRDSASRPRSRAAWSHAAFSTPACLFADVSPCS